MENFRHRHVKPIFDKSADEKRHFDEVEVFRKKLNEEINKDVLPPLIPDQQDIMITQGNEYELEIVADYGAIYIWDGVEEIDEIHVLESNQRKIRIDDNLAIGTYPITLRVENHYGFDEKTFNIIIEATPIEFVYETKFNGTDESIDIDDCTPSDIGIVDEYSCGAYFRKGSNTGFKTIVHYWSPDPLHKMFAIRIDDSRLTVYIAKDNNFNFATIDTGFDAVLNQRYHVLCTVKNNTISVFLDGLLIHSDIISGVFIPSNAIPSYIGSANGSAHFMNGRIDEVTVWNKSLTPLEVLEVVNDPNLYNHSSFSNLKKWYRMGDGIDDATTVYDIISGYNGTLINMDDSNYIPIV